MTRIMTKETKEIKKGKMVTREFMISFSNLCDIGDTIFKFFIGNILYEICESITSLQSYEDPSIACCFIRCTIDENDIPKLEKAKFTPITDRSKNSIKKAFLKQEELFKKNLSPTDRYELFGATNFTLDPIKSVYRARNNSDVFICNSREN